MKTAWVLFFILAFSELCVSQRLKIAPEKPSVTDSIFIEYDPQFFGDESSIQCLIYFSGIGSNENDFPKVREVQLIKSAAHWQGYLYPVPLQATAMVITIRDSLGNRDNNNHNGYWKLLYRNGRPLPGSWTGAGDLLYGKWITENCMFHLGENLDSVQAFFNREVRHFPEVKRIYMRQYLASFKTGTPEADLKLKNELTHFSAMPLLSESNLLTLRNEYSRLKDTLNANRVERQIFTRFPHGMWTPQAKSLPLLIQAGSSRKFNEQVKAYQEFKGTFLKSYDNSFTTFAMNYRAARMLVYMVNHFSAEGTMDLWKKEASLLTDRGKFAAYQQGSQKLLDTQSNVESSQTKIENKLYQFNLSPNQQLKDAEDLALLAITLWNKGADSLFRQNESAMMTQNEVTQFRNNRLSDVTALLGLSLLRQNKVHEAVIILKESVERNNYTKPETNELYIEALVKSGNMNLALAEARSVIALGKSTPTLDIFYVKAGKEQNNLALLKEENLEKVKSLMMQKLIREKTHDFTTHDLSGNIISSKFLKNKIIVITFWASWCPPCIMELKSIDAAVKKFKSDQEVVFLSVNEDEVHDRAMKIINEYGIQNHFVFDEKRKMAFAFGATGLPAQVLIGKDGDIRFRNSGLSSFNEQENTVALEAMISLLKELK